MTTSIFQTTKGSAGGDIINISWFEGIKSKEPLSFFSALARPEWRGGGSDECLGWKPTLESAVAEAAATYVCKIGFWQVMFFFFFGTSSIRLVLHSLLLGGLGCYQCYQVTLPKSTREEVAKATLTPFAKASCNSFRLEPIDLEYGGFLPEFGAYLFKNHSSHLRIYRLFVHTCKKIWRVFCIKFYQYIYIYTYINKFRKDIVG